MAMVGIASCIVCTVLNLWVRGAKTVQRADQRKMSRNMWVLAPMAH